MHIQLSWWCVGMVMLMSLLAGRGFVLKSSFKSNAVSARIMKLGCMSMSSEASPAAASAPVSPPVSLLPPDLAKLEIRVGKIIELGVHPESDGLYVEKIDLGEANGPRTIVSGLVQYCPVEIMLNRKVIVVCNLKPRSFKGIESHGMILCASNADHSVVEPIVPPEEAAIGELIAFEEGLKPDPCEVGNRATKIFNKLANDFFVDDNGQATFKGVPFKTQAGIVKSTMLKGKIS